MAKESQVVSISAQDDLFNWVFVNQSDFDQDSDDHDSIFEFEDVELLESSDSYSISSSSEEEEEEEDDDVDVDNDVLMKSPSPSILTHPCDIIDFRNPNSCDEQHVDYDDDDDDDNYDGYDMDDELVPWAVKDRFERQRIRKLGKRACAKMTKSKKSVLLYTKPGCVRGKHGLGLKAY